MNISFSASPSSSSQKTPTTRKICTISSNDKKRTESYLNARASIMQENLLTIDPNCISLKDLSENKILQKCYPHINALQMNGFSHEYSVSFVKNESKTYGTEVDKIDLWWALNPFQPLNNGLEIQPKISIDWMGEKNSSSYAIKDAKYLICRIESENLEGDMLPMPLDDGLGDVKVTFFNPEKLHQGNIERIVCFKTNQLLNEVTIRNFCPELYNDTQKDLRPYTESKDKQHLAQNILIPVLLISIIAPLIIAFQRRGGFQKAKEALDSIKEFTTDKMRQLQHQYQPVKTQDPQNDWQGYSQWGDIELT